MTLDTTFKVKGEGHQAALVGCTVRPTWTYSNGDVSVRVHDVYRVATWRPLTACLLYYVLLVLSLIDLFVVYDVTAAPRATGTSFFFLSSVVPGWSYIMLGGWAASRNGVELNAWSGEICRQHQRISIDGSASNDCTYTVY